MEGNVDLATKPIARRRILFVDDEPEILEVMKGLLQAQANCWDMAFVSSGAEALAELAAAPFDVVVSDFRMPFMDGEQLLEEVQRWYPRVARFILSAEAEVTIAAGGVSVAHQFLAKPMDPQVLRVVVDRTCGLLDLIADDRMEACLGGSPQLPSLPRACRDLDVALANNASTDVLVRIIEGDMALSAKLLRIINSAYFGLPYKVSSVRSAVITLGTRILGTLPMSVHLANAFNIRSTSAGFSPESLQAHSLTVARLAQQLSNRNADHEHAFAAGMLHDVGKLVLAANRLEEWRAVVAEERAEVRARGRGKGRSATSIENAVFHVTHAEVGAYLIGLWGLPMPVVEAVAHHHHPERAPHQGFCALDAVYLGNLLANEMPADDKDANDAAVQSYLASIGASSYQSVWARVASDHRMSAGQEQLI
jgi:putative nucleotidyltransferase with HDIG domain